MGGNRGDPILFFFSSRRRHTRSDRDWSSDVCSSDLVSYIRKEGSMHYVRGLMAENNASIYAILPYTSFDLIEEARFPQSNMESRKKKAFNDIQIGRASCRERV